MFNPYWCCYCRWSEGLNRVVNSQKDYLKHLTSWLRLSLMQFGADELEKNGSRSPSRSPRSPLGNHNMNSSPIYGLCQQWLAQLDQLPDRVVLEAIGAFAGVVREMLRLQWEELRIKKRVEQYRLEYDKREMQLVSYSMREYPSSQQLYNQSMSAIPRSPTTTTSGSDNEAYNISNNTNNELALSYVPERSDIAERRAKMESARRRYEEEVDAERKAYTDTRAYTLNSLQAGLPQLFNAVIMFANAETDIYDKLSSGPISKLASIAHK